MTHQEAIQHSKTLTKIANLQFTDILDWLALLEDQLRKSLAEGSQLLVRFRKIRAGAEQKLNEAKDGHEKYAVELRVRSECQSFIELASQFLESEPSSQDDLKTEIDRIIQDGYFKSVYFRGILLAFGVLLLLITGVGTLKITDQVQAMQKMLDDAKKQVAESNAEIAKARSENNNRQAEMALLLLQGNADLVKQRTNAMIEMSKAEEGFRSEVAARTTHWIGEADKAGAAATEKLSKDIETKSKQSLSEIDKIAGNNKQRLQEKLITALSNLEAVKRPWVPIVIWSIARSWLLLPLSLVVAILAMLSTAFQYWGVKSWIINLIVLGGVAALLVLSLVFWRNL